MNIIILAAGVGSRLRPLTHSKPKGMVKVNGLPIIAHQIKAYLGAGVAMRDITVAVGYQAQFIIDYVHEHFPLVQVRVNDRYDTTNNMFSLNMCVQHNPIDTTIVSNGDCVYEPAIIKDFINARLGNAVACDKGAYTDENMKVIVDEGRIRQISKQITCDKAYGNSIDLYRIDADSVAAFGTLMQEMIAKDDNLWSEMALDRFFATQKFEPFDIDGRRWMEIDNYADLYDAEIKFSDFSMVGKKAMVFDLDGTVYLGSKPIQGTIDFIRAHQHEYDVYYMTNNTSKNLNDYVERLSSLGIEVAIDKIISPLLPLVDHLKSKQLTHIYLVGNTHLADYLSACIPEMVFTDEVGVCQAVVVGYDTQLNYEKLRAASVLLHHPEVQYIATHEDMVCPTELGDIPDIGAMLLLLEATVGRRPTTVLGKPNPVLLKSLRAKFAANEMVVVGDRIYTDKVLANNAGIDFVLVYSGETQREDVEVLEKFPELMIHDCACLESFVQKASCTDSTAATDNEYMAAEHAKKALREAKLKILVTLGTLGLLSEAVGYLPVARMWLEAFLTSAAQIK